jgi:hypothetical protein
VFRHERLKSILQGLSVHLVEASHSLSAIQEQTLSAIPSHTPSGSTHYKTGQVDGVDISWYQHLEGVPQGDVTGIPATLPVNHTHS